jgi:hypothetical protein
MLRELELIEKPARDVDVRLFEKEKNKRKRVYLSFESREREEYTFGWRERKGSIQQPEKVPTSYCNDTSAFQVLYPKRNC